MYLRVALFVFDLVCEFLPPWLGFRKGFATLFIYFVVVWNALFDYFGFLA